MSRARNQRRRARKPALRPPERDLAGSWNQAFRAEAVEVANSIRPTLNGDFARVRALVDDHQLVFGVWQDPAEPNGVGMMIVKGHQALREIVADGASLTMPWTAIPCVCAEQAEALRAVAGEADRLH